MKPLAIYPHRYRREITRRSEQGQSFIEFALIVPILFLMLVGVSFIAQGFNLQMVLYGAAYEGVRVWARNPAGGDNNHCSPPACDPNSGTETNFDRYVVPAVRQYVTNNGYDGSRVIFYNDDPGKSKDELDLIGRDPGKVEVSLFYPYDLPIGNFAGGFQPIMIGASCTMKRGS